MRRLIDRRAVLGAAVFAPLAATASRAALEPDEAGFVHVPGGKVWWRRYGDGPKTPLLCLHGGPGAGSDYLFPLCGLGDEREVIFYDQLGCGRSDAPNDPHPYAMQHFVDELDAVRHALGLKDIALFGNSWGTMLAIEYLLQGRGHGVKKLVLSGALASVPQAMAGQQRLIDAMPNGAGKRIHALEKAGKTNSPEYEALTDLFYRLHVCRLDHPPPAYAATITNLSKSPAYRFMNGPNEFTITGNIRDWDRRKDLRRIKVPTLITTGEFDEITRDCEETIHHGIEHSQLVVMKGCSHLTMLEKPDAYNAILRRFLG
jgi:proline iminopeptidase